MPTTADKRMTSMMKGSNMPTDEQISQSRKLRTEKLKGYLDRLYAAERHGPFYERNLILIDTQLRILMTEAIDDYIDHRLGADKTLQGILKDIQGNIASMAENGIAIDKREK